MSVETTTQSWGGRLGGSIKGIFIGILLFIAAIILLFWNEGRAVSTKKALDEGQGAVVDANIDQIEPAKEGKLVHISGQLKTNDVLEDDVFGVTFKGIKLRRIVEIYQWQEEADSSTTTKMGGSTETTTTYSYKKDWSEGLTNSNGFHDNGHDNPRSVAYNSATLTANNVTLGKFNLSDSLVNKLNNYEDLSVNKLKEELSSNDAQMISLTGGMIYIGENYNQPKVGDLKISYEVVKPGIVSIISQQKGGSFTPYMTAKGETLELLSLGNKTSDQMFTTAQTNNKIMTWVLRFVGFLIMVASIRIILKPFEVMGDVIPFIGGIIGFGIGIVSILISVPISLATMAIAWFFYRPLLAVILIVVGVVVIVFVINKIKKYINKDQKNEIKN